MARRSGLNPEPAHGAEDQAGPKSRPPRHKGRPGCPRPGAVREAARQARGTGPRLAGPALRHLARPHAGGACRVPSALRRRACRGPGIGEAKLARYGLAFLEVIKEHLQDGMISVDARTNEGGQSDTPCQYPVSDGTGLGTARGSHLRCVRRSRHRSGARR
jgi:hypothetical protein